jgi:hypothetical protein
VERVERVERMQREAGRRGRKRRGRTGEKPRLGNGVDFSSIRKVDSALPRPITLDEVLIMLLMQSRNNDLVGISSDGISAESRRVGDEVVDDALTGFGVSGCKAKGQTEQREGKEQGRTGGGVGTGEKVAVGGGGLRGGMTLSLNVDEGYGERTFWLSSFGSD